ncbi:hypothetical protein K502DRAFT_346828, partial [Neoconidiobolus thromboides FSU 785]
MKFVDSIIVLSSFGTIYSHMEVISPAPRRSKHLTGNKGAIDYDMSSPLGGQFSFP